MTNKNLNIIAIRSCNCAHIVIIIGLVSIFGYLSITSLTAYGSINVQNASNAVLNDGRNDFVIVYPSDWNITSDKNFNTTTISPNNYNVTMEIGIHDTKDNEMDLSRYLLNTTSHYDNVLDRFILIDSSINSTLSNLPAYKLLYTYYDSGQQFSSLEFGTLNGTKVYYMDYDSPTAEFSNYLPSMMEIINSVSIVKK